MSEEPFIEFAGKDVKEVTAAVQGVMVGLRTPWLRQARRPWMFA